MEQDDLTREPEVTLHKLNVYYDISEDPKFLRIAADYCRWLAMESGDEEYNMPFAPICPHFTTSGSHTWTR